MKPVNIVTLPDLHLGHPKVGTVSVHRHLIKYMYPELKNCDLLVIGGDFFHDLIGLNSAAGYHAISIIDDLINMAFQYHFYIRIVRGTFTHDRMQNKAFIRVNRHDTEDFGFDNDSEWIPFSREQFDGKPVIAFFNTVSVETDLLGMNLLYIPDDLPYENVMDHIHDVMEASHVKKVDLVISHGYFKHLLPLGIPRVPKNTLDWKEFEPFVKGCVLNGHVHIPSVYEKVVSGGSFERMCHGEEEDKGFFTVVYDRDSGKTQFSFHRNPEALLFRTIRLNKSPEKNIDRFKAKLKEIISENKSNAPLHLRIAIDDQILKQSLIAYARATYPDAKLDITSIKIKELTTSSTLEDSLDMTVLDLPIVTEENLPDLLLKHAEDNGEHGITRDEIQEILKEVSTDRR